jgi:hypothetical protein
MGWPKQTCASSLHLLKHSICNWLVLSLDIQPFFVHEYSLIALLLVTDLSTLCAEIFTIFQHYISVLFPKFHKTFLFAPESKFRVNTYTRRKYHRSQAAQLPNFLICVNTHKTFQKYTVPLVLCCSSYEPLLSFLLYLMAFSWCNSEWCTPESQKTQILLTHCCTGILLALKHFYEILTYPSFILPFLDDGFWT